MPRHSSPPPFPTRDQVIEFVRSHDGPVGRREIARAFHIRGQDRVALRALLKELEEEGLIGRQRGKRYDKGGRLPPVTVLVVSGIDPDGDAMARPQNWDPGDTPPKIYVAPPRKGQSAPGLGDRILARLREMPDGTYEAQIMRRLEPGQRPVIGIYDPVHGGRLRPTDRRVKSEFVVPPDQAMGAVAGEIVRAETLPGKSAGLPHARIVERIGTLDAPNAISLIALQSRDIPIEFPDDALAQAKAAKPVGMKGRTDLRDIPLVTIDDQDARDFDDAVWAAPDTDPENEGGWHILVAIADVAAYVRPGDALDQSARQRGNSVYFPDRVVPMLPEELSNGLCSLVPDEDRPCMAVHMWIDSRGKKRRHEFVRAMMRSAARLTYDRVQAMADGGDDPDAHHLTPLIEPLYGAYRALERARKQRGVLELDLPERKVVLNDDGAIDAIEPRARHDSHKLIEEFMILANVAAAEELERLKQPCMYRVHDEPTRTKLEVLRDLLREAGLKFSLGQVMQARLFNRVLEQAADTDMVEMVNQAVLRTQSQAVYSPENIGHFGLALRRYAHFTSPIRRYSDLLVHRALISGLDLGSDGLPADAGETFEAVAAHISSTERRAMEAERDSVDRLTVNWIADRIGETFVGTVNGVTRAGLFVVLEGSGADGFLPVPLMGEERFRFDHRGQTWTGEETGVRYRGGQRVRVRLAEANTLTGSLVFEIAHGGGSGGGRGGRRAGDDRREGHSPGGKNAGKRSGKKPGKKGARKGRKKAGKKSDRHTSGRGRG